MEMDTVVAAAVEIKKKDPDLERKSIRNQKKSRLKKNRLIPAILIRFDHNFHNLKLNSKFNLILGRGAKEA